MAKIKTFIAFLLGVGAGGAGAWYLLKDAYARQAAQDILSAKDAFHIQEEKLKGRICELKEQVAFLTPDTDEPAGEEAAPTVLANSKVADKGDIAEYARGRYHKYDPANHKPAPEPESDISSQGVEAPYVISPDEFGELEAYTQVSLTFYADGILADENGVIVDDIEEIIGDGLDHLGEYEDGAVHCRSDAKRCDYEVLQDLRRYADVRKTFPPNL